MKIPTSWRRTPSGYMTLKKPASVARPARALRKNRRDTWTLPIQEIEDADCGRVLVYNCSKTEKLVVIPQVLKNTKCMHTTWVQAWTPPSGGGGTCSESLLGFRRDRKLGIFSVVCIVDNGRYIGGWIRVSRRSEWVSQSLRTQVVGYGEWRGFSFYPSDQPRVVACRARVG